MRKFILEWISSIKEQERIKKIENKKLTEQAISDVFKYLKKRNYDR